MNRRIKRRLFLSLYICKYFDLSNIQIVLPSSIITVVAAKGGNIIELKYVRKSVLTTISSYTIHIIPASSLNDNEGVKPTQSLLTNCGNNKRPIIKNTLINSL